MKVQVNLDENTMDVTEKHEKTAIIVTVRLAHHDIRDADIRSRMTQLWTDLHPLKEFIETVVLETTASNVSVIQPFTWMFPLPVQLELASRKSE